MLPSASRAARGGMAVDEESIPQRPPYVAYITNLPYDVDDGAIRDLFDGLKIQNLRLPREGDRLKGYGYVDFEERDGLINALNISDLTISGRRIRIEVVTPDNDRRMGNRGGRSDRERDYDPERTMGDWRSGPRAAPEPPSRSSRPMERENTRERESSTDNRPGAWRDGDRPAAEPARTPYGGRDSYGRDKYDDRERGYGRDGDRGYGGRDGFRAADSSRYNREGGRGFGERRGFGDRDRDPPREEPSRPRERPKLNLLPRTIPREVENPTTLADGAPMEEKVPEKPAPKPVPAEKVFGAAKPVDTAAKEREIEERLLKQQEEEARRGGDDKDRWGRKGDDTERRGGARRDDRSRDSKGFNRDRRDYSRDGDRRDDRDRRDGDRSYDRDKRDGDRSYDRNRRDGDRSYDRDRRDIDRRDDRSDRRDGDRKDDRDRRDGDRRDDRDRKDGDRRDDRDKRDYRDDSDRRECSRDDRERRDNSRDNDGRVDSPGRSNHRNNGEHRDENGKNERPSRSRERCDDREERPMPKLKEQEKPNFVASNKFSYLEDENDGGGSD